MDRTSLRGRGGGRGRAAAAGDARHRARVRRRARRRASAALEAPPRARTSSSTPSARPRRRRAATGARGWPGWRASAATCGWRSSACCAPARREDALRIAIAFARALPWDAHAHEVRGWLAAGAGAARARAESAPRRRAVLGRAARALAGPLRRGRGAADARRSTRRRRSRTAALEAAALTALGRRAVLVADPSATGAVRGGGGARARRRRSRARSPTRCSRCAGACERVQDWQRAAGLADEALALYREAGDPTASPRRSGEQGFYDMVHGRLERSEQRLGEALELRRQLGDDRRLVEPLIDNAWLDLARGERRGRPARVPRLPRARPPGRRPVQRRRGAGRALARWPRATGSHADAARLAGRVGGDPRAHRRAAVGVAGRDPRARAGARAPGARRRALRGAPRRGRTAGSGHRRGALAAPRTRRLTNSAADFRRARLDRVERIGSNSRR